MWRTALRQTLIVWASLLIFGGLAFLIIALPIGRAWLWQHTGEEAILSQIKGVSDLASDWVRPSLDLAADELQEECDVRPRCLDIPHTDLSPYGINVFLDQEAEPAKRELAVQMASKAGFDWLRQEFIWEDIEIHGRGDFEDRRHEPHRSAWEKYDHIVDLATQYDMEVIARISNPPSWTRHLTDTIGSYAPPDDFDDYANFVSAVVDRYEGRIRYYQLWNEPNIYPEWGNYPIDPENYTNLLRIGAKAAREADPNVVIIASAMAATINLQPMTQPVQHNSLNDLLFLQRMYNAGAADYFDIVAVQGYGLYSGPTDTRMHPRVINISRHHFVRDLMVKNGDAHKPIWIAEMNWNVAPKGVDGRYGKVTPEQQAHYLPTAYERLETDWPWIGVASTWYLKRATGEWEEQQKPEAYFRLLRPDFSPLPVYESMKKQSENR